MKTITIPVNGMHCGACSGRVQKALAKTDGVQDATVDLAKKSATITYDEGAVRPEKFVEVVAAQGYEAGLPDGGVNSGVKSGTNGAH